MRFIGGPWDAADTDSLDAESLQAIYEVYDGAYGVCGDAYRWGRVCSGCGAVVSVDRADQCPLCGSDG